MDKWQLYTLLKAVADGSPVDKLCIQEIEAMHGAEAIEGIIEFMLARGKRS